MISASREAVILASAAYTIGYLTPFVILLLIIVGIVWFVRRRGRHKRP